MKSPFAVHYGVPGAPEERFCVYAHELGPECFSPDNLADFIRQWLLDSDGVRACKFRYVNLQRAVHFIVDDWVEYPSVTDYWPWPPMEPRPDPVERRVKRFLPYSVTVDYRTHDIHKRTFFWKCVLRYWLRKLRG